MATTVRAIPTFLRVPIEILDRESEIEDATIIQIFKVYTKGNGTPTPIVIETDRIFEEYEDNYPDAETYATLKSVPAKIAHTRRANLLMRRDLLHTVIENFNIEDANILSNSEAGEELLIQAGWLDAKPDISNDDNIANDVVEDAPKGEGVIGVLPSLTSMQDIQESE